MLSTAKNKNEKARPLASPPGSLAGDSDHPDGSISGPPGIPIHSVAVSAEAILRTLRTD